MMFIMDSKAFNDYFLKYESDKTILKAQYVVVSSKIKVKDRDNWKNIINTLSTLYPSTETISGLKKKDQKERYFKQLDENIGLIATLVKYSLDNYNVIFLCTFKERKMNYLDWLSEYIFLKFKYMVYDYELFVNDVSELYDANIPKIEKKCDKLINEIKNKQKEQRLSTEKGRELYKSGLKNMSKKELKKELDDRDLYRDGMSKSEMIDMLKTFI